MRNVGATLLRALRRDGCRPVFLVEIGLGDRSVFFSSGPRPFADPQVAPSVTSVTPVAQTIDVFTREYGVGTVEVTFADDGALRSLIATRRLHRKRLALYLGVDGMDIADFQPAGVFAIDDVVPGEGEIVVRASDAALLLLKDTKTIYCPIAVHPMQAVRKLLEVAGIPSSLVVERTFDPDQYQDSISHWCVSRAATDSNAVLPWTQLDLTARVPAMDLARELLALLDASLIVGDDGRVSLYRYERPSGPARTWTRDDVSIVRPIESFRSLCTRYSLAFNRDARRSVAWTARGTARSGPPSAGPWTSSQTWASYSEFDLYAEQQAAYPGEWRRSVEQEFSATEWLTVESVLVSDIAISDGAGATFSVLAPSLAGFCGARGADLVAPALPMPTPVPQPASATLTAQRRAYVWIEGELIECDRLTFPYAAYAIGQATPTGVVPQPAMRHPLFGEYRIRARGVNGTPTRAHRWNPNLISVPVLDYTIPVDLCRRKVDRFAYGCPIVEVTTSMAQLELEVSDTVSVADDVWAGFGRRTDDGTQLWEIISKECDVLGDSPGIKWTLAGVPT